MKNIFGKMAIFSIIALSAMAAAGCAAGPYRTEEVDVSGFDRISIETFGEIIIEQTGEESLTVEAPRDYLRYIESEVDGDTLVLRTRRGFFGTPARRVTYTITVDELEEISLSGAGTVDIYELDTDDVYVSLTGAGSIEIDELTADELEVNLTSAGAIVIAGEADTQDVNLSGVGSYEAGDLRTAETRINLSGAGSAVVWVEDYLDVNVSGVGSVAYYGENPDVRQSVSGLGSVNARGER